MFRKSWYGLALVCVALLVATGCDPQAGAAKDEEISRLNQLILNSEQEIRDLMQQVKDVDGEKRTFEAALAGKDRRIAAMQKAINALQGHTLLGEKVQYQLQALAQKFGGKLIGRRLELPGDFFFGSGKYEDRDLRDAAKAGLKEMATLLKGEDLMLLIVGHTDGDPIKNPALRRKDIHTNRHLSVLRALTVLNSLKKAGYPENLMYPTGWGELYRLDKSGAPAGKALNRRVEILIDPAGSNLFGISKIIGIGPAGDEPVNDEK